MCPATDPGLSYRIPQSDPPIEIRDASPRVPTTLTDPVALYRGLLTLSSLICGELPPERIISERRVWAAPNTRLQLFIWPQKQPITYATACQIVRGIGEYTALADLRFPAIHWIFSQEQHVATAGGLSVRPMPGESQNSSAVDVA